MLPPILHIVSVAVLAAKLPDAPHFVLRVAQCRRRLARSAFHATRVWMSMTTGSLVWSQRHQSQPSWSHEYPVNTYLLLEIVRVREEV